MRDLSTSSASSSSLKCQPPFPPSAGLCHLWNRLLVSGNRAVKRVLSSPLLTIATHTGSLFFLWVLEKGKADFKVKNRGFCERRGAGDAPEPILSRGVHLAWLDFVFGYIPPDTGGETGGWSQAYLIEILSD